jgi:hypothetical protein
MIPPQPDDGHTDAERFNRFAKKLLRVPKKAIDKEEKKEARGSRKAR